MYCSANYEIVRVAKNIREGASLEAQWLGLWASTAAIGDLIAEQGTKVLRASQHGQRFFD